MRISCQRVRYRIFLLLRLIVELHLPTRRPFTALKYPCSLSPKRSRPPILASRPKLLLRALAIDPLSRNLMQRCCPSKCNVAQANSLSASELSTYIYPVAIPSLPSGSERLVQGNTRRAVSHPLHAIRAVVAFSSSVLQIALLSHSRHRRRESPSGGVLRASRSHRCSVRRSLPSASRMVWLHPSTVPQTCAQARLIRLAGSLLLLSLLQAVFLLGWPPESRLVVSCAT